MGFFCDLHHSKQRGIETIALLNFSERDLLSRQIQKSLSLSRF
jgi:hypothetical protein